MIAAVTWGEYRKMLVRYGGNTANVDKKNGARLNLPHATGEAVVLFRDDARACGLEEGSIREGTKRGATKSLGPECRKRKVEGGLPRQRRVNSFITHPVSLTRISCGAGVYVCLAVGYDGGTMPPGAR